MNMVPKSVECFITGQSCCVPETASEAITKSQLLLAFVCHITICFPLFSIILLNQLLLNQHQWKSIHCSGMKIAQSVHARGPPSVLMEKR